MGSTPSSEAFRKQVKGLATHLAADSGYRRHEPGVGYVCPRADKWGARDGVIPPGVAAARGLIPKGMREVTNDAVVRRARDAGKAGVPDPDRYEEYYGRGAAENAGNSGNAGNAGDSSAELSQQQSRPEQPAKNDRRAQQASAPAAVTRGGSSEEGTHSVDVAVDAIAANNGPSDPSRVFPDSGDGVKDAETLDDFYAGLEGSGIGTSDFQGGVRGMPGGAGKRASAAPASPLAQVPQPVHQPAPQLVPAPTGVAEVLRLVRELEAVRSECATVKSELDRALREYASLSQAHADLEARYRDVSVRLEAAASGLKEAKTAHGKVRVRLSGRQEKMKLGGRDALGDVWEVRIMGHADFTDDGDEMVLTVIDQESASELLASMIVGEVIVLTAAGRFTCAYRGLCDKIYGDDESPDFITLFRFTVTGSPTQEGV